ncbi:MAG: anti-ECFsigma factor, ChrR [Phycisphaerales bacterium]|nr:anti-ECFsigma factor, ChrR [Phycisphaerales bacterium]
MPDDADRAFPVPPKPVGISDVSLPQAEMRSEPVPAVPVKLIFADLLQAATDGSLRWEKMRPGVEMARLYAVPDGGPSAALLRYTPGAKLQRHEHTGFEHIYVLSGSQVDDSGEHRAGALLIHGPGTSHTIASKHGCIVLAVWERPVRFLGS